MQLNPDVLKHFGEKAQITVVFSFDEHPEIMAAFMAQKPIGELQAFVDAVLNIPSGIFKKELCPNMEGVRTKIEVSRIGESLENEDENENDE